MKALKPGQTANISVDIGGGPNQGVTFQSTNSLVATVNSSGLVTAVANPSVTETCHIIVRDSLSTNVLAALRFLVVPSTTSQEKLNEINNGELVFKTLEDTSGPTGGELSISVNSDSQLVVNYVSPVDADSGITALYLSVSSTDGTDKKADKLNVLNLASPRYYSAQPGKTYSATLIAVNGDGVSKTLTATAENLVGWNMYPWNFGGYGL